MHRSHTEQHASKPDPSIASSVDGSREAPHQDLGRKPGPDPAASHPAGVRSLGVTAPIASARSQPGARHTRRRGFAEAGPAEARCDLLRRPSPGRRSQCLPSQEPGRASAILSRNALGRRCRIGYYGQPAARPGCAFRAPGSARRRSWTGRNVQRRRAYRGKPATFGWSAELARRWLRSCTASPTAIRFWKLPRSSRSRCNSSSPSCSSRRRMRRLPFLAVSQSSHGRPQSSPTQVSVQKKDSKHM